MEVSGNSGKILELADSQRMHKQSLEVVLDQVDAVVVNTLLEWEGDGQIDFDERYKEFSGYKSDVIAAFDHLITKTEESAEQWALTGANVQTRFQV